MEKGKMKKYFNKIQKAAAVLGIVCLAVTGCGTESQYLGEREESATQNIPESSPDFTESAGEESADSGIESSWFSETGTTESPNQDSADPMDIESQKNIQLVSEILNQMTLEQKISQMLMPAVTTWSLSGQRSENVTELNPEIAKMLQQFGFGGVILFAQNITDAEQTVKLTDSMQKANQDGGNRAKLFIAVDQEGGSVARLATGTTLCGNMALGAGNDETLVKQAASLIGEELDMLGINVDFAPVMDVNSNPANPVIGIRSFSDDPNIVANMGASFVSGLRENGIISVWKHFPGHGDTQTDSHTGLPLIDKSLEELKACDLIPFQVNEKNTADMIMTAHIQYPRIETKTYFSKKTGEEIYLPATLSETIITGILRNELGFDGVVTTDAMNMDAIAGNFDAMDAARFAINAGVDMILMPVKLSSMEGIASMEAYIKGIVELVETGEISKERIDESVERILKLKAKYGLLEAADQETRIQEAKQIVGSNAHHDMEWEITLKTITLLKNEDELLPLDASKRIVIACPAKSQILSVEYGLLKLKESGFLEGSEKIEIMYYGDKNVSEASDMASDVDIAVIISALYGREELNPASAKGTESAFLDAFLKALHQNGKKAVLISAQLPYDAARYEDADAVMAVYGARGMTEIPGGFSEDVQQYSPNIPAGIYTVFGGSRPVGKLPVNIYSIGDDYSYTDEIVYERGFGLEYED